MKVLPEWQKCRVGPSLTDLISVFSPFTSTPVLSRKKSLWWLVWISKFGSTSISKCCFAIREETNCHLLHNLLAQQIFTQGPRYFDLWTWTARTCTYGSMLDMWCVLSPMLACRCCRRWYAAGPGGMNVFDRRTKRLQKNRAAMAPDAATYDYIRDEVCVGGVKLDSWDPGLLFPRV